MSPISTNTSQEDLTLNVWVPNCLSDNRDRVIRNFNPQKSTLLPLPKGIEFHEQLFLTQPDAYILAWYTLILNPEIFAVNPISLHATVRKIDDIAMFQLKVPLSLESQLILLHIQVWCELMFPLLVIDLDASSMKIEDMVQSILLELFWDEWLLDKIINNKEFSLRIPNDDIYFKYKNTLLALLANYSILLIKRGEYEWWIEMIKVRYIIANALYNQTWVFLAHRDHCFALLEQAWYDLNLDDVSIDSEKYGLIEELKEHLGAMAKMLPDLEVEMDTTLNILSEHKPEDSEKWSKYLAKEKLKLRGQCLITKLLFDVACGFDSEKLPWMVQEWHQLAELYGVYPPSSPVNGGEAPITIFPDAWDEAQLFWIELKLWEYCRKARWSFGLGNYQLMNRLADKQLPTNLVRTRWWKSHIDAVPSDNNWLKFATLWHDYDHKKHGRKWLSIHLRSYIETLRIIYQDYLWVSNYTFQGRPGNKKDIIRQQLPIIILRIYETIVWISDQESKRDRFFGWNQKSPLARMLLDVVCSFYWPNKDSRLDDNQWIAKLHELYLDEQRRLRNDHQNALSMLQGYTGYQISVEMRTWTISWSPIDIKIKRGKETNVWTQRIFDWDEFVYGWVHYRFCIFSPDGEILEDDQHLQGILLSLLPWIHRHVIESASQKGIWHVVYKVTTAIDALEPTLREIWASVESAHLQVEVTLTQIIASLRQNDVEIAIHAAQDMLHALKVNELPKSVRAVTQEVRWLKELVLQVWKWAWSWMPNKDPRIVRLHHEITWFVRTAWRFIDVSPEMLEVDIRSSLSMTWDTFEWFKGTFIAIVQKLEESDISISSIKIDYWSDSNAFVCTFHTLTEPDTACVSDLRELSSSDFIVNISNKTPNTVLMVAWCRDGVVVSLK